MKTNNSRLRKLTAIIFFLVLAFVSCTKVTYPEASENPVFFTYEAQMQHIRVKNVRSLALALEYPSDEWVSDEGHSVIGNDWISFTLLKSTSGNVVQIDVKENTTSQPRTHGVDLNSGTEGAILMVTQAGKP